MNARPKARKFGGTIVTSAYVACSSILFVACTLTGTSRGGDAHAADVSAGNVSAVVADPQTPPLRADTLQSYTERVVGTTVSFEMVPVVAGEVVNPESGEEETIGPFWIGRTEVSWDLYDVFVFGLDKTDARMEVDAVSRPSKPYVLPGDGFGHAGMPALGMTAYAAAQFARWLSAKTGRRYRMMTELEWEYVCRRGSSDAELEEVAWYWDNAGDRTHPVGDLAPDGLGLNDILGNAAEWTVGSDGVPVIKGGSFQDDAKDVHCGARRLQTKAWNITDPQLPKSKWWLSDAPFVGLRIIRDP